MSKTDYLNIRCPKELRDEIDKLVAAGVYRDRTHFVIDAIKEKLFPEEIRERRKQQILLMLRQDPTIRAELGLE